MNDDFALVREVTADSVLWRMAERLVTSVTRSWRHSGVRRRGVEILGLVASWSAADRLRAAAAAVAIAGLVNITLLVGANPYAAPGVPRTVVAIVVLFAVIVAMSPQEFVRAWPSSIPGRIGGVLRRLIYKPAE